VVLECRGAGSPVVLGIGGRARGWQAVQAEVARFTRTCVFEHIGQSTTSLTTEQMAQDVHRLLRDAQVAGPYVPVGFSLGGYVTRLYANLYPDTVVGMVLVDASHEDQTARFLAALPPETSGECQELRD